MDIKNTVTLIKGVKKALVYCQEHAMEEAINKNGQQTIETRKNIFCFAVHSTVGDHK